MPIALSSINSNVKGAMVPLGYTTSGSANFSNIPQTYAHLKIQGQIRGVNASTGEYGNITINGGSTIYYGYGIGDGASVSSNSNTPTGSTAAYLGFIPGGNSAVGLFATYEIWVLNYANTTTYKTIIWRCASDQNSSGQTIFGVGTVQSTAAVTQLNVYGSNGSATGTTHTIYGIKGAQ